MINYKPAPVFQNPYGAFNAVDQALNIAQDKGAYNLEDAAVVYSALGYLREFFKEYQMKEKFLLEQQKRAEENEAPQVYDGNPDLNARN
jgi:hypothetical protein